MVKTVTRPHLTLFCSRLVLSGHRAAEEGGEKVGQEVQVDEHEGGVWPSLLHSLAEPLHSPRPRQGRPLPVHCVKKDWSLPILLAGAPTLLNHFDFVLNISLHDISGCLTVSDFLCQSYFFKQTITSFPPPSLLPFPLWSEQKQPKL